MKSRPWPILLFGFLHVLNPFYSFFVLAWFSKDDPLIMFARFQTIGQILEFWCLFPIAGLAMIAMRSWSYPVIFAVWGYNFYTTFQAWSQNPESVPGWALVLNYVLSVGVITYFLVPNVKAVYYNPRLRWWDQKPRFFFEIPCEVEIGESRFQGVILDLSEGGVFLACERALELNDLITLHFEVAGKDLALSSEVVHKTQDQRAGYGMRFAKVSGEQLSALRGFLEKLRSEGISHRDEAAESHTFWKWMKHLFSTGRGIIPEIKVADRSRSSSVKEL